MIIIYRFGVYHWKSFKFEDNTSKDKYFIALNCKINDIEISVVLPTSQIQKYNSKRLIDTIFIKANESQFFTKDTIIDLKNIKIIDKNRLDNALQQNKINYLGKLEDNLIKRIETAIIEAITLSNIERNKLLCK